ncbi:MAG: polysaccharide deacetylase family protein [Solirubrobacterales bacterium]
MAPVAILGLALAALLWVLPTAAEAKRIVGGPAPETLVGTPNADRIEGRGAADSLLGRAGADRLAGGPGSDTIHGGSGRDRIFGGSGDDQIRAGDGTRDSIACGTGWDIAVVDPIDSVASDCELIRDRVERPAVTPVAPTQTPSTPIIPPAPPGPDPETEAETPAEPLPAYEEKPLAMFPAGHGWTGNGEGEFSDAGGPFVVNNDRSFKIKTDGFGDESVATSPPLEAVDLRNSHVAFQALISFSSRLKSVKLRLASGDIGSDYAEATIADDSDPSLLTGNFEMQSIPRGEFNVVGSVDWSAIDRAQIVVTDNLLGPVELYVAGIYAIPTYKTATVSFAFDDGLASTYTLGLKKLSAFRYPASEYVIANTVGTPGFMSQEQLFTLQNQHSWEIGGHAGTIADHNEPRGLDDLDPAELKKDFDDLRTWMDESGFERRTFAYPKGAASAEVRKYAARDYCAARVTGEGPETIPPRNPFTIRGWSINGLVTEAGEIEDAIDRAVAEKTWLVITFHNLVQGTPVEATDFSYAAFSQVVAHVRSLQVKKQLQVRTIADAVGC